MTSSEISGVLLQEGRFRFLDKWGQRPLRDNDVRLLDWSLSTQAASVDCTNPSTPQMAYVSSERLLARNLGSYTWQSSSSFLFCLFIFLFIYSFIHLFMYLFVTFTNIWNADSNNNIKVTLPLAQCPAPSWAVTPRTAPHVFSGGPKQRAMTRGPALH